MNAGELLQLLDHERRSLARGGEILTLLPSITRLRSADGSHHNVIFSSLAAADADAAIRQEIEHHQRLGVGFEWKLYSHDRPADLLDRLGRFGFKIGLREVVLIYDLSQPLPFSDLAGASPPHTVVRVDSPEQVAVYRRVAEQVFGKDYDFTARELADDIRGGLMQHRGYIAYADDRPVSIGRLYTHPQSQFGGLYGGGTLPAYRGQGFYRAMVVARARDAAARGARYLIVDALPTSLPVLERMGFERVAQTWPCEWELTADHVIQ
ncbi:MAG TPA: GNAT family N-acetyltransferase [Tepidisphaeraceae bacterium]|nr:GNAT family N-acetyltransferase [Tepidisphaeraceae bacterium]